METELQYIAIEWIIRKSGLGNRHDWALSVDGCSMFPKVLALFLIGIIEPDFENFFPQSLLFNTHQFLVLPPTAM